MTAGIDFGAAFFIHALPEPGVQLQPGALGHELLIYAIVLFVHGLLNQFGIRLVALLNDISVWWHILGVLIIVGVLAFAPSHHQSASFVFGHFYNGTGLSVPCLLHRPDRPARWRSTPSPATTPRRT